MIGSQFFNSVLKEQSGAHNVIIPPVYTEVE